MLDFHKHVSYFLGRFPPGWYSVTPNRKQPALPPLHPPVPQNPLYALCLQHLVSNGLEGRGQIDWLDVHFRVVDGGSKFLMNLPKIPRAAHGSTEHKDAEGPDSVIRNLVDAMAPHYTTMTVFDPVKHNE